MGSPTTRQVSVAWTLPEAEYADRRGIAAGRRLGCHALIEGPLVVDVPPDSQIHRQVIRKRAEVRAYELDPVVTLHHVEVTPPDLSSSRGDLSRLLDALEREWGVRPEHVDAHVLTSMQSALRNGRWGSDRCDPRR